MARRGRWGAGGSCGDQDPSGAWAAWFLGLKPAVAADLRNGRASRWLISINLVGTGEAPRLQLRWVRGMGMRARGREVELSL